MNTQQGGSPSPFDRILGLKFGGKTLDYMVELLDKSAVDGKHITYNMF